MGCALDSASSQSSNVVRMPSFISTASVRAMVSAGLAGPMIAVKELHHAVAPEGLVENARSAQDPPCFVAQRFESRLHHPEH